MQASRWHETTNLGQLTLEFLFWLFSDYGRSIVRPIGWLIGLTFFLSLHYINFEWPPIHNSWMLAIWNADWQGSIECTFHNAVPLLGGSRYVLEDCRDQYTEVSFWFRTGHSLLSFALLFLTGLGLRNRFRL